MSLERLDSNDATFAAAIEPYRRELRAYCRRFVADDATADDLVQETIVRAWRARSSFEERSTLRTWLYRIATNVCLDELRRLRLRAKPADLDELAHESTATDDGPEASILSSEMLGDAVLAAIQHLPPRQRAVLVLRDGLGWSADETAVAIDCTTAAANSALQRARATVRRRAAASGQNPPVPAVATKEDREAVARYVHLLQHGTPARAGARDVGVLLGVAS